MAEEPRINNALQSLMMMLDQEVPKELINTSFSQLDREVVAEAEDAASLSQPLKVAQQARAKAREMVASALRDWLEATDDCLRAQN